MHGAKQSTLEEGQTPRGQVATACPTPGSAVEKLMTVGYQGFREKKQGKVLGTDAERATQDFL